MDPNQTFISYAVVIFLSQFLSDDALPRRGWETTPENGNQDAIYEIKCRYAGSGQWQAGSGEWAVGSVQEE